MTDIFLARMDQTKEFDENVVPFLQDHGFTVVTFGQNVLLGDHKTRTALRKLLIKNYSFAEHAAGFMMKFSPDFICTTQKETHEPFFLDTKSSVTPILFEGALNKLRDRALSAGCPSLERGDVGVIEREAWRVYTSHYPPERTAICFSAPYHPRLVAMEWCSNIKSFYRYEADRNLEAGGSGTPHVNIHLGMMRTPVEFLRQEFDIEVDDDAWRILQDGVKNQFIKKPKGTVNWAQFTNTIKRMQTEMPWIDGEMPDEVRKKYFKPKLPL